VARQSTLAPSVGYACALGLIAACIGWPPKSPLDAKRSIGAIACVDPEVRITSDPSQFPELHFRFASTTANQS
jgi:hypothetical protein